MRKLASIVAVLLALAYAAPAMAYDVKRVPLAVAWDMEGLVADVDYNVLATQLTDSKSDYVISNSINETCRKADVTIVDADNSITAGLATVTGTDCWGDALVCTFTFASGGSGSKTLVFSTGTATTCAFKTITNLTTGVLTGESGALDTISAGYPADSGYQYPIYGTRKFDAQGHRYVDPFTPRRAADDVTVNGTALASYKTVDGGAFQNLAVGSLIYLTTGGTTYERRLTVVASDDSATMDVALPASNAPAITAQVRMDFKNLFILREGMDAWVPVSGSESVYTVYDVDSNTSTGGVISSVECAIYNAFSSDIYDPTIQLDTATVATGGTGTDATSVDLRLAGFSHCRVGVNFGTSDDAADAGIEDINVIMMVTKEAN